MVAGGGGWQLVAVGSWWRLAVGGPWGRSFAKKKMGFLQDPPVGEKNRLGRSMWDVGETGWLRGAAMWGGNYSMAKALSLTPPPPGSHTPYPTRATPADTHNWGSTCRRDEVVPCM